MAEAEKKRKALTNRKLDGRFLQKPKMRDLHRVSAMAAVIISVFLMLEIPLMVITIIHAVKPQVHIFNELVVHVPAILVIVF